ncbi:twin-arginine translocation signal domain-containing protein [Pedomonas sp. V897]|uniref:twin-arginine translocation signal domain-containing protein n=1 Tax=Pedomonas sp. V897 TaxID=3446482 RepID=UPI003EDEFC5F
MTDDLTEFSRRKFLGATAAAGAVGLMPAWVLAQAAAPDIVVTLRTEAGQTLTARAAEGKPWPAPFNGQTRWELTRPIGPEKIWISFGRDADGRVDVWFYLAFSTQSNSVVVPLATTIAVDGKPVNLWGQGPNVTVRAVRSTLWRWQSRPRKWQFERIPDLVNRNVLLRHSSSGLSQARNQTQAYLAALGPGVPFTSVTGQVGGTMVGDFMRGASSGGERETIGLIHEKHARVIEEVLAGNMAYAQRSEASLQLIQELIGQYPGYFFFHVDSGKVLDPSDSGQMGKVCWHRNAQAAVPARYIPQAGTNNYKYGEGTASWDIAHPHNHHFLPYLLTDDPYYLLMAQMNATAAIGYGTARFRMPGYQGVVIEEERGLWWGLRQLFWAEVLTPASGVPQPFLPRSYFTKAIDQTFTYVQSSYDSNSYQDLIQRFWGNAQVVSTETKYWGYSPFMNDYGHEVLLWMYLAGRPIPQALMLWKFQNLFNRILLWGDYVTSYIGIVPGINAIVAPKTGTALPYNSLDTYHQWVTAQRKAAGLSELSRTNPRINFSGSLHRDWHIVHGLLNLLKPARAKGLPVRFDPAERLAALMATTIDTRTGKPVVFPVGATFFAKQGFRY